MKRDAKANLDILLSPLIEAQPWPWASDPSARPQSHLERWRSPGITKEGTVGRFMTLQPWCPAYEEVADAPTTAESVATELRFVTENRSYFDASHVGVEGGPAPADAPALWSMLAELLGRGRGAPPAAPGRSNAPAATAARDPSAPAALTTPDPPVPRAHDAGRLGGQARLDLADRLAEAGDRAGALVVLASRARPRPVKPPAPDPDVGAPVDERGAARAAAEIAAVLARDLEAPGARRRFARLSAIARAGQLTLEAFRAHGGQPKRDALRDAARALEHAQELGRAAETYALAGALDEQARLGRSAPARVEPSGEAAPVVARMTALARRGQRLAALAEATTWLAENADLEIAALARSLVAALVRGPVVVLRVDGVEVRVVFGDEVTIGRTGASIVVASRAMSRQHVRLSRAADGQVVIEDLGSHNGTWLAGARVAGPLTAGDGLALMLAREIPCVLRRAPAGLAIDVAGERYVAPLGELHLGRLVLWQRGAGDDAVIALRAEDPGVSLGDEAIAGPIELCHGDVVRAAGGEPMELRVAG